MLRPPSDNPSIRLFDRTIDAASIHRALTHPAMQLLQDGGTRTVWKSALFDNSPVIIKCRENSSKASGFRRLFRISPHDTELRGLRRLLRLGIPTSTPLARVVAPDHDCLVLKYVPGPTLLEVLAGPPLTISQEKALCRAVGDVVIALILKNFYYRDNKPSNLIVLDHETAPRIAIIDAVGIRYQHPFYLTGSHLVDMLASLYLEPRGVGITIRRTLTMRLLHGYADAFNAAVPFGDSFRRDMWEFARTVIEKHGDPTPKVNPLAAPGAISVDRQ